MPFCPRSFSPLRLFELPMIPSCSTRSAIPPANPSPLTSETRRWHLGRFRHAGKGLYNFDQATAVFVTTGINVTKGMKDQMKKLVDADTLTKNDSQFVQNTIDVLDLVLREANDLKDFIASGKQNDAQAYDSSRKKALKEIKTLLSIKD